MYLNNIDDDEMGNILRNVKTWTRKSEVYYFPSTSWKDTYPHWRGANWRRQANERNLILPMMPMMPNKCALVWTQVGCILTAAKKELLVSLFTVNFMSTEGPSIDATTAQVSVQRHHCRITTQCASRILPWPLHSSVNSSIVRIARTWAQCVKNWARFWDLRAHGRQKLPTWMGRFNRADSPHSVINFSSEL